MALFIADLAFDDALINAAKLGIFSDRQAIECAGPAQACAVRDLISQAFERAVGIPEAHRDAPAESAERLLEKETLRGDELPLLNAEPGVQISAADPSQEALHEPAESRRKAAARQAMKRAEDTKG